jgi:hypothetical protein
MDTSYKRFWDKVKVGGLDECWEWKASRNVKGYGKIGKGNPLTTSLAHRLCYYLTHGNIPLHHYILHSCNNPGCCNPTHLRADTQKENMLDKILSGHTRSQLTEVERNVIRYSRESIKHLSSKFKLSKRQIFRIRSSK